MGKVIIVWDNNVAFSQMCFFQQEKILSHIKKISDVFFICLVLIVASFSAFEMSFTSGRGYQRNRVEENLTVFV